MAMQGPFAELKYDQFRAHPLPRREAALHRRPRLPDGPDAAGLLLPGQGRGEPGQRRRSPGRSRSRPTSSTSTPTTSPIPTASRPAGLAAGHGLLAASASATRSTAPGSGTRSRCSRARATSARSRATPSTASPRAASPSAPAGPEPRSSRSSPPSGCTSRSPATRVLRLNALLDSDSVAGAYDFTIEPGAETVMEIARGALPARRHRHGRHRAADLDVLLRPREPGAASTTSATRCTTAAACG